MHGAPLLRPGQRRPAHRRRNDDNAAFMARPRVIALRGPGSIQLNAGRTAVFGEPSGYTPFWYIPLRRRFIAEMVIHPVVETPLTEHQVPKQL